MTQRPDCECHGEPMWLHTDTRRGPAGTGYWRCSVRNRERQRRDYWKDPIRHARVKEERRRNERISRMTNELKELLDA